MPIAEANIEQLRQFVDRPGRGASAIAAEVSHLRGFYRWLVREERRVDDPTVRLERPSVPKGQPRPMPDDKVRHSLANAPEPIRTWLMLAAYAGLRACEIAPLRGCDFQGDWIYIRVQKGGDPGRARITPPLRALATELSKTRLLFPMKSDPMRHVAPGDLSTKTARWLREQGIAHSLHTLRHWFGTNVRRTSDLLVAQRALRHASIQSTVIYTDIEDDELGAKIDEIPDLALKAA